MVGDLCSTMVEEKWNITYPLLFRLLKLALILPISTSTVERAFSAINVVKTGLHNRICDPFFKWLSSLTRRGSCIGVNF